MSGPETGWITHAVIDKVHDGDTVNLMVSREFSLRITDKDGKFNTPEISRCTQEEKEWGLAARDYLKKLVSQAKDVRMYIPASNHFADALCIGNRLVGYLYLDGIDVTTLMEDFNKAKVDITHWQQVKHKYV